MNEWTEQEEQQIIERAKTGDPEANYALSLWALHRGEEEPDEPRWNRLAAKCLVKAAQAGYGPAKEQMASLLSQSGQSVQPAPAPRSAPAAASEARESAGDDGQAGGAGHSAPVRRNAPASRPASTARRAVVPRRQRPQESQQEGFDVDEASWDDGYDEDDTRPLRRGRRGTAPASQDEDDGAGSRPKWGDDKWRRLEFICVFICAALLIIIAIMVITSKHGGDENKNDSGSAIPPAGEVASADNGSGGTAAADYPDEATRSAIMAADLDIQPAPEDYVTEPTSGTVSVSSEYLRLRKGPNVTYDPIAQMPNGTAVSVFATKNDWDLILYQGDDGPVYGWCSNEYVILTAGAAGATATDDPGTAEG